MDRRHRGGLITISPQEIVIAVGVVRQVGYGHTLEGCLRNFTYMQLTCRVPRSLDIKVDGKVANSSYAENVLGAGMAGQCIS